MAPDTLKPVPVIVAALTVTAAVPVELSVTVSVEAVFTTTLPNATLVALILSWRSGPRLFAAFTTNP